MQDTEEICGPHMQSVAESRQTGGKENGVQENVPCKCYPFSSPLKITFPSDFDFVENLFYSLYFMWLQENL